MEEEVHDGGMGKFQIQCESTGDESKTGMQWDQKEFVQGFSSQTEVLGFPVSKKSTKKHSFPSSLLWEWFSFINCC